MPEVLQGFECLPLRETFPPESAVFGDDGGVAPEDDSWYDHWETQVVVGVLVIVAILK